MVEERAQRRLAAILAADVIGYSKLMGKDEEGTLTKLTAHLAEHIEPCIADHRGRVVKTTGDGLLAEFGSVVDAVRCALAFQEGMAGRNTDAPEDPRIEFRIGVNIGDVIVQDDDVFGDGVNVAARIESLCEPGGVYVSGTVYDHVSGKLPADFDDLGEHTVKNIARPVRVYRARAETDQPRTETDRKAVQESAEPASMSPYIPSIAVLPFANTSGDAEQEYFADGLTEDLITALTRWQSFPVISRNSCFAYKGKNVDVKQAARDLGAGYIVEGSVRKGGARVRIAAHLVDGTNGHHVWAEKYDRSLDDIFDVQDEIVQRISAIVAPEMDRAALDRSIDKRSEDLDAWDLCLRAKSLLRQSTFAANVGARELFERALEIDNDSADAYSGLAQSYNQDILVGAVEDLTASATLAVEAARNAIRCNPASSWAHHELSTAYQWLNRLDDALDEARSAVDLNPNNAYAVHALGNKSDLAGDPSGIAHMERAQNLNPEDALRHMHLTFLARAYVAAGDFSTAADRARQAIGRNPDYVAANYLMGIALAHLGRIEEARAALEKCDKLSAGFVESRRDWRPYTDKERNEQLLDGRRKAGLSV
ncbi:MAG: tetratricopeptide repeat protein [Rhodospirillales bacterium]|nr:tetratricopeptide repeat protein [Rhodospirillales bacterium]